MAAKAWGAQNDRPGVIDLGLYRRECHENEAKAAFL